MWISEEKTLWNEYVEYIFQTKARNTEIYSRIRNIKFGSLISSSQFEEGKKNKTVEANDNVIVNDNF